MDYQRTRSIVLDFIRHVYLKEGHHVQLPAIADSFRRYVEAHQENPKEILSSIDSEDVLDIFNSFMTEGLIRWGLNASSGNSGPPYTGLTKYGKLVLTKEEPTPYDPYGYFEYLEKRVPKIDKITKMYLEESLESFLRHNLLASAVMLGVAAEAVFNMLYDALANSIQSEKIRKKFDNLRDSSRTKIRINLVRDTILVNYKAQIDTKLTDDFESKTDPIFNLIRQLRNDVGHPTGMIVDNMTMFVYLQLFVSYYETVYKWIEYLKKNNLK